jgi:hypothetical protein
MMVVMIESGGFAEMKGNANCVRHQQRVTTSLSKAFYQ